MHLAVLLLPSDLAIMSPPLYSLLIALKIIKSINHEQFYTTAIVKCPGSFSIFACKKCVFDKINLDIILQCSVTAR